MSSRHRLRTRGIACTAYAIPPLDERVGAPPVRRGRVPARPDLDPFCDLRLAFGTRATRRLSF